MDEGRDMPGAPARAEMKILQMAIIFHGAVCNTSTAVHPAARRAGGRGWRLRLQRSPPPSHLFLTQNLAWEYFHNPKES